MWPPKDCLKQGVFTPVVQSSKHKWSNKNQARLWRTSLSACPTGMTVLLLVGWGQPSKGHTLVYCHRIHTAMFRIWAPARVPSCFRRARYVCVLSSGSFRTTAARVSFTWARLRPAPKVSPEMKPFVNHAVWLLLAGAVHSIQDLHAASCCPGHGCWWWQKWWWWWWLCWRLNILSTNCAKHSIECSTESPYTLMRL